MKISEMKDRVSFYTTGVTPDGAGGFEKKAETLVGVVWGKVIERRQTAGMESGQVAMNDVYEITIRSQAITVDRAMFIKTNGQQLSIESVIRDTFYTKLIAKKQG